MMSDTVNILKTTELYTSKWQTQGITSQDKNNAKQAKEQPGKLCKRGAMSVK